MKRLRYDGPGRLILRSGRFLPTGEVAEVEDDEAAKLSAHPHIDVTVLGVTTRTADGTTSTTSTAATRTTKKRRPQTTKE